ncbi:hypothetical protein PI125_g8082 [Phytophthora idaei]|nr:hypothetical protein PI125_g8082 [Phytophthora idaei]
MTTDGSAPHPAGFKEGGSQGGSSASARSRVQLPLAPLATANANHPARVPKANGAPSKGQKYASKSESRFDRFKAKQLHGQYSALIDSFEDEADSEASEEGATYAFPPEGSPASPVWCWKSHVNSSD